MEISDKEENYNVSNSNNDNLPKDYYRKIWSNHLIIMNSSKKNYFEF